MRRAPATPAIARPDGRAGQHTEHHPRAPAPAKIGPDPEQDGGHDYSHAPRAASSPGTPAGAVVDDATVAHPHDALRDVGDRLIVSYEHDRESVGVQTLEELEDRVPACGVERARRFVGEQHRRLVRERAGDCEPLAFTAGQRSRKRGRLLGDPERGQERVGTRRRDPPRRATEQRGHHNVLTHRHRVEEVEELEHDPDVVAPDDCPRVLVEVRDRLPRDGHGPFVGAVEARDHVEQRRLAAPRGTHDRDELPGRDVEARAPQRAHRRVLGFEGPVDRPEADDRLAHPGIETPCRHVAHVATTAGGRSWRDRNEPGRDGQAWRHPFSRSCCLTT